MTTNPTMQRSASPSRGVRRPTARSRIGLPARGSRTWLLLLPAVALLAAVFVYPLAFILWGSFTSPATGLDNYTKLIDDGVSIPVLVRTLIVGLVVATVTLAVAYPYAYFMTVTTPRVRQLMTVLVLLPFWTSMIARNFAWYVLLQRDGAIDKFFSALGFDGVVLLGTTTGVTVAMVQVMLPFMVLPLYSSMAGIDRNLVPASSSLGAPFRTGFLRVYLPLSMPGVLSGFSMVFILVLGFYVTPALLGSPQQSLVSQLIADRVNNQLDFGGAGAFGAILLVITLAMVAVISKLGSGQSATGRMGR